jgi:hypothetical protein
VPHSPGVMSSTARPPGRSPGRRRVALVLVVVASLLAPIAVDAFWIKRMVLDTDRFVAALGPLADDPDVQAFVAATLSDQILAAADLGSRAEAVLPPGVGSLVGGPLESVAGDVVRQATAAVVQTDQFAAVWRQALRLSHAEVVALLTGDTERVTMQDGTVHLDLSPLVADAQARIDALGLGDVVPDLSGLPLQVTLFQSDALAEVQWFVELLDLTGFVLPVSVAALWALALLVSNARWRTTMAIGLGLMAAMVGHLAALLVGRSAYLDAVTTSLPEETARAIYRILVDFPRTATLVLVVVGGVVAVVGAVGARARRRPRPTWG